MTDQLWIYQIGDSSKPGSYTMVNGVSLIDEGSGAIYSAEQFRIVAADLVDQGESDDRYALVRVSDDSREVIETYP